MQDHVLRVGTRAIAATFALALATIVGVGVSSAQTGPGGPDSQLGPPQAWGFNSSHQAGQRGLTTMVQPGGFLVIGKVGSYVLGGTYGRTSDPCNYAYGTGGFAGYQGDPRSTTGSSLDGHGSEHIVTGETQRNCER